MGKEAGIPRPVKLASKALAALPDPRFSTFYTDTGTIWTDVGREFRAMMPRAVRQQISGKVRVAPPNRDSGLLRGRRVWGGWARVRPALYMASLAATM